LLEIQKSRGRGRPDQMSHALNRLRAMVSLPKYSPPMPRPHDGRSLRDLLESEPRRGKGSFPILRGHVLQEALSAATIALEISFP
jgi:hypothetical protein